MNRVTRTIIGCTAAIMALAATSCSKDDTLRYNNATMGNIVEGRFVSDQGNTFNVVEQNYMAKIDTMKRAFMICDILNTTAGATDEYDVRVNYLANVLTKDPVVLSENPDEEKLVNDAIILSDLWISGGYINLYITVPIKIGSDTKHMINLILDETAKEDGTYTFTLRHDASGEILKDGQNNTNMVLAAGYVSFPVSHLIKEDQAKIKIKWYSYRMASPNMISSQTENYSTERLYKKDSFEQVPSTTYNNSMTTFSNMR
jgi:hypothetical protein